jgi:hypothetical protein
LENFQLQLPVLGQEELILVLLVLWGLVVLPVPTLELEKLSVPVLALVQELEALSEKKLVQKNSFLIVLHYYLCQITF